MKNSSENVSKYTQSDVSKNNRSFDFEGFIHSKDQNERWSATPFVCGIITQKGRLSYGECIIVGIKHTHHSTITRMCIINYRRFFWRPFEFVFINLNKTTINFTTICLFYLFSIFYVLNYYFLTTKYLKV